jgi:hypothetical protein
VARLVGGAGRRRARGLAEGVHDGVERAVEVEVGRALQHLAQLAGLLPDDVLEARAGEGLQPLHAAGGVGHEDQEIRDAVARHVAKRAADGRGHGRRSVAGEGARRQVRRPGGEGRLRG